MKPRSMKTMAMNLALLAGVSMATITVAGLGRAAWREFSAARDAASAETPSRRGTTEVQDTTPDTTAGLAETPSARPDAEAGAFHRWAERLGVEVTQERVDDFMARNARKLRAMEPEAARREAADRLVAETLACRAAKDGSPAKAAEAFLPAGDLALLEGDALPPRYEAIPVAGPGTPPRTWAGDAGAGYRDGGDAPTSAAEVATSLPSQAAPLSDAIARTRAALAAGIPMPMPAARGPDIPAIAGADQEAVETGLAGILDAVERDRTSLAQAAARLAAFNARLASDRERMHEAAKNIRGLGETTRRMAGGK